MTVATISAFESTIHKTNTWLRDIRQEMNWKDSEHERSYRALRVVLHALRDRLSVEEASDLSAQLPLLVRGIFFEGWNPTKASVHERKLEEFLAHVEAAFSDDILAEPEQVARAVLRVLRKHVTEGEIDDIRQSFPKQLRSLWD